MEWLKEYGSSLGFAATLISAGAWFASSAIRTQRELAKKRTTLDFFLRTETDGRTLDLWKSYNTALSLLAEMPLAQFKTSHREEYEDIKNYLNVFELLACGLKSGALDEEIAKSFFWNAIVHGYTATRELLEEEAKLPDNEEYCCDFISLAKQWKCERDRSRKTR